MSVAYDERATRGAAPACCGDLRFRIKDRMAP